MYVMFCTVASYVMIRKSRLHRGIVTGWKKFLVAVVSQPKPPLFAVTDQGHKGTRLCYSESGVVLGIKNWFCFVSYASL